MDKEDYKKLLFGIVGEEYVREANDGFLIEPFSIHILNRFVDDTGRTSIRYRIRFKNEDLDMIYTDDLERTKNILIVMNRCYSIGMGETVNYLNPTNKIKKFEFNE